MTSRDFFALFPKLDATQFQITSPETPTYNCIAYAAGDFQRWWWPDSLGDFYWPEAAQRVEHLSDFQQAFETLGFKLAGNGDLEGGVEKIAIFAKQAVPTHAARQLETGAWSSKLGPSEDVSHNLEGVENPIYGSVAFFMQRPRS
jgi:hypothetical protein